MCGVILGMIVSCNKTDRFHAMAMNECMSSIIKYGAIDSFDNI